MASQRLSAARGRQSAVSSEIDHRRAFCSRGLLAAGARRETFGGLGVDVANWPLSAYRQRSYYSMRTDALDRFGTRIEHRMTRAQIKTMMESAGLQDIRFSEAVPFWCAVGRKN